MTGTMCVMGVQGDTKIIWSSTNPDEVENAKTTFNNLRGKGYLAYSVEKGGGKGEVVREFDPSIGKLILVPPMKGG